jgi:GNAT superfamily N-acetyltransferase
VTFRRASVDDIPALLELQQRFYAGEGYPYDRTSMERAMRELIANANLGRLFIADGAYLVITFGFSLEFGGRDAFVDELYVAEEARGQGLGTLALEVAETACREAGIHALHLEVEHVNARARALYERSGYEAHERHLMTKKLGSGTATRGT